MAINQKLLKNELLNTKKAKLNFLLELIDEVLKYGSSDGRASGCGSYSLQFKSHLESNGCFNKSKVTLGNN